MLQCGLRGNITDDRPYGNKPAGINGTCPFKENGLCNRPGGFMYFDTNDLLIMGYSDEDLMVWEDTIGGGGNCKYAFYSRGFDYPPPVQLETY